MGVNLTEFYVQLLDTRTGLIVEDSTGRYTVMTINTATRPTIYSDRFAGTTITNSIGTILAGGVIQFWIDAATTSVDLTVTTALGQSYFLRALTADQHRLDIDQEKREQVMIVPFNGEAAAGTDFNTLHNFPIGAIIKSAQVVVITLTASETMDIGITGVDPNGLMTLAPLDAVGVVEAGPTLTTGIIETYISTIGLEGALLSGGVPGVVGTNAADDFGISHRQEYYVVTAGTLSLTHRTTNAADGYGVVFYTLLPPHV